METHCTFTTYTSIRVLSKEFCAALGAPIVCEYTVQPGHRLLTRFCLPLRRFDVLRMGFGPNFFNIEFLASLSSNVSWLITAALFTHGQVDYFGANFYKVFWRLISRQVTYLIICTQWRIQGGLRGQAPIQMQRKVIFM